MDESEAINKMVAPGTPREGKYRQGVIQIHVTRSCDKACFNCTQGSNLAGKTSFITLENFELACKSLSTYWGVVGVFGGNPAIHPYFEELCAILGMYIPREQRGLWCNNPLTESKAIAMRRTFNPKVSNLNVHLDATAYKNFKTWWPESMPFGLDKDSRHSPPYVAMKDVVTKSCPSCEGRGYARFDSSGNTQCYFCNGTGKVPDESRIWELISECPINKHWSAMVCVVRGQLRAYFCEIAGAQAMLHEDDPRWPDTGMLIVEKTNESAFTSKHWWEWGMDMFVDQVKQHCFSCGVPLNGYGELAQAYDGTQNLGIPSTKPDGEFPKEQVSETHIDIYRPKRKNRRVEVVTELVQLEMGRIDNMTKYLQNSSR